MNSLPASGWMPRRRKGSCVYKLLDKVQSLLKERGEDAAVRPTVSGFLLSGKVLCGRCQHHYVGVSGYGRWGGRFRYYACQGATSESAVLSSTRSADRGTRRDLLASLFDALNVE